MSKNRWVLLQIWMLDSKISISILLDHYLLQEAVNYSYLLIYIDRFSHWPEVYPIKDISAVTTVKQYLLIGFQIRHIILTMGRGRQFESILLAKFNQLLGISRIRITANHYNLRVW